MLLFAAPSLSEEWKKWRRERSEIRKFKQFHPRAVKLMRKRKNFIVISEDEPYFRSCYNLIRTNECLKGTWTFEDEQAYRIATAIAQDNP
jgi:hypothetical protein